MKLFKKDELAEVVEQGKLSFQEKIRRREFCVQQAAFACDEQPMELLRLAEKIYAWVYEEQP